MSEELYEYLIERLKWLKSLDASMFKEDKNNINSQISLISYILDNFAFKSENHVR